MLVHTSNRKWVVCYLPPSPPPSHHHPTLPPLSALPENINYQNDDEDDIIDTCRYLQTSFYIYLLAGRGVCKVKCVQLRAHSSVQSSRQFVQSGVQALVSIDQSEDLGVHSELCMT